MADVIRNNFTSGEIDPSLHHRPELDQYASGARLISNFIVKPQGGLKKRQGTRVFGESYDIVVPFIFNDEENYIVGISENGTLRVTTLEGEAAIVEGETRIATSALDSRDVDYSQNADVMVLTTGKAVPYFLKRTSKSPLKFLLEKAVFTPRNKPPTVSLGDRYRVMFIGTSPATAGKYFGNFRAEFIQPTSAPRVALKSGENVTVSGFWGAGESFTKQLSGVTLVAAPEPDEYTGAKMYSAVEFSIAPEGDSYPWGSLPAPLNGEFGVLTSNKLYSGTATSEKDKGYSYVVTAVIDGEETYPSAPAVHTMKAQDSSYGLRISWALQEDPVDGGEVSHFRVYKETPYESGHYGWIGDSVTNTFVDFNLAGITSDTPPRDFFEPHHPRASAFYQQRLVYGGDADAPLSLTATATGSYTDVTHRRPANESDAFNLSIAASKYDRVQHLETTDSLVILSAGGIWRTTEGESEKFTPSTTTVRKISSFGADGVKPVHVGSSVIYSQAGSTRIRDLFAPSSPNGENTDITVLCPHLFEGKEILQIAYSEHPIPAIWAVVADRTPYSPLLGKRQVYVMSYDREQGVGAWSRVEFNEDGGRTLVGEKLYLADEMPDGSGFFYRYATFMEREPRGVVVLPSPQGDRVLISMRWQITRAYDMWVGFPEEEPRGYSVVGNEPVGRRWILEELPPEENSSLDFSAPLTTGNESWRAEVKSELWWTLLQDMIREHNAHPSTPPQGSRLVRQLRPEQKFVGLDRRGVELPVTGFEEVSGKTYLNLGEDDRLITAPGLAERHQFDRAVSHVGLKFTSRVELLPVVGPETPHRAVKSVNRVSLWVRNTIAPLFVGQLRLNSSGSGPEQETSDPYSGAVMIPGEDLWEVKDRSVGDDYSGPHPTTGLMEANIIGQWDVQGSVVVEHRGSRGCEISAVEFDVDA